MFAQQRSCGFVPCGCLGLAREQRVEIAVAASLIVAMGALGLTIGADPRRAIDDELRLIAPDETPGGALLPLRALLYRQLHAPEGERLAAEPVQVELFDAARRSLARATLRRGFGASLEGELAVPEHTHGILTLRADARPGVPAAAERRLHVRSSLAQGVERAQSVTLSPRPGRPPRATSAQSDPLFTVRVAGGSCAPEWPCDVWIALDPSVVALALVDTESVTLAPHAERRPSQGGGVAHFRVITHGTEAHAQLQLQVERSPQARVEGESPGGGQPSSPRARVHADPRKGEPLAGMKGTPRVVMRAWPREWGPSPSRSGTQGTPRVVFEVQPRAELAQQGAQAVEPGPVEHVAAGDAQHEQPEPRAGGSLVRALELPVALGTSVLQALPRVWDAPARLELALHGGDRGCIVDAFGDGVWARTGSLEPCTAPQSAPFAPLPAGLWRLQVRRDPFESSSAAVATVYVQPAGQTQARALAQLAAAAGARDPSDRLARAVTRDPQAHVDGFAEVAGYLLALLDEGIMNLPVSVSGMADALRDAAAAQANLRALSLLALALCAGASVALVLQRGLAANAAAAQLLQAFGPQRDLRRTSRRQRLRVLAVACAVLAAFAAIAAYILARAGAA